MGKRLDLHTELLQFLPNVYFQPPSNIQLTYPCIIYHKSGKSQRFGNDKEYMSKQQYKMTVIDRNPDSDTSDLIESDFEYCQITGYYTMDNLHHTSLTLYY